MFIWRVFRRLLAQIIRLLFMNRVVTLGLIAVLIAAFVVVPLVTGSRGLAGGINQAGSLANGQPVQAASAGAPTQAASSTETMAPDPAVQTYIKGMLSFDANTMWTSLHPQFRAQLQSQGITLDTMKTQETQKAGSGVKYDKVFYIGSFQGQSGLRYYFYAVTFSGTDSTGQPVSSEYAYTFTVAPDGGGIYNIGVQ